MYGDLACLCLKYLADNADNIADIVGFEPLVIFLTYVISLDICLNTTLLVLNINKRSLTHDTLAHNSSCDGNLLVLHCIKVFFDILAVCSYVPLFNNERVSICILQSL